MDLGLRLWFGKGLSEDWAEPILRGVTTED